MTPAHADEAARIPDRDPLSIGRLVTFAETHPEEADALRRALAELNGHKVVPVLGITGTGGSGKSSLVDELVRRFLHDFDEKTIAIISVDP